MTFSVDKCVYLHTEEGKIVKSWQLTINNATIRLVTAGDNYRHSGIDKNIEYNGPINKERISKEYLSRVKKIWSSELSDFKRTIAPTVGVIDRTIKENILHLQVTYILTSKFWRGRLYINRVNDGRGLNRIKTLFENRIVSNSHHLKLNSKRSQLLVCKKREQEPVIRASQELMSNSNINIDTLEKTKSLSKKIQFS